MQLERIMDKSIVRMLFIFTISASMIAIVSTGLWLLNEPSEMCLLGKAGEGSAEFTSIVYIVAGSSLIISVVYLFHSMHKHRNNWRNNDSDRFRLFVVTLFGLQLVLLILFTSLYALTQSTVRFASLQRWIVSPERWVKIGQCLYQESKVCVDFECKYGGDTVENFLGRHLTPIESGCCKPPIECDFNFWSPTKWMKPLNGTYSNSDCYEWENDSKKLCYDCQACKLGYSQELKKAWTISGATVIISLLILALGFMLPIHLLPSDQEPLLS